MKGTTRSAYSKALSPYQSVSCQLDPANAFLRKDEISDSCLRQERLELHTSDADHKTSDDIILRSLLDGQPQQQTERWRDGIRSDVGISRLWRSLLLEYAACEREVAAHWHNMFFLCYI